MRDNPEVQKALSLYQLGIPKLPVAGRSGDLLGRGTGSSVEFQEFREYMPGDDIRHLDWSTYARTDTLMVRLFREEISPKTEILMDASRSMSTHGEMKAAVTKQLTSMFLQFVSRLGGQPRLYVLDDEPHLEPATSEALDIIDKIPFSATATLPEILDRGSLPFQPQSVRIVISDFLFPHDPGQLIRRLSSNVSALWIVQVLSSWELNPVLPGGRRFVDIETQSELDVMINPQIVQDYLKRLGHLQKELAMQCQRAHAQFVTLNADDGLLNLCQGPLCQAEILRTE